jgi:protein YIPF6
MREVLYPKYLFGGSMLANNTNGLRGAYESIRGAGLSGAREELVGLAGRAMDADHLLAQGNMSEGVRDWDLWGPLVFCLLLSLLLSFNAQKDQKSLVFSGVFALVWIGEAVVTMQIKLLGGNMFVSPLRFLIVIGLVLMGIDLSPNPSALSVTRSFPSSSQLSFLRLVYTLSHVYPSISCSWHGR